MEEESRSSTTFDDALTEAEKVAEAARRATAAVALRVRKLKKASSDGNVADLRKVAAEIEPVHEQLRGCLDSLSQAVEAAVAWPGGENADQSFKVRYSAELCAAAEARDLPISEREGFLTTFPSIVSVSEERAVSIDRKKEPAIRPSRVVEKLAQNRKRAERYSPSRFLAAIYKVYVNLSKSEASTTLPTGEGPVVPLASVYDMMTVLPGARLDYTKAHFARDLFALEYKGVTRTKTGAEVILTGSTGTRQAGFFSFVGPDGQEGKWSGVKFRTDGL